jgi:hypothetical protein
MKYGRMLHIASWFLAGAASALVVPNLLRAVLDYIVFPEQRDEISRVSSPDGAVDGVMIRSDCGAPCSTNYSVFVVPKGSRVRENSDQKVFSADDMSDQRLTWSEPHLLEIGYGRALIISFQNVTSPFTRTRNAIFSQYRVEIRLAPALPGFSYLKEHRDSQ